MESGQDPYLAILDYRNTPRMDMGSPVQRLYGRRTKTLLPTVSRLLKPKLINPKHVRDRLKSAREVQKKYYDRQAKPLSKLKLGDPVTMATDQGWLPARVTAIPSAPRSFIVTNNEGGTYRRNRRHLRPTPEGQGNVIVDLPVGDVPIQSEPDKENTPNAPVVLSDTEQAEMTLTPPVSQDVRRTASGREVRRPAKFQDYV